MDKNDSITSQEKRDNNRMKAIISILVVAALLIADLYVMVNMPNMIIVLIGISVLLLAAVYVFINAILKEINQSKIQTQEQYENIFKSEKASYILLKKAFEQLEGMESKSTDNYSSEDIITAQKAIAKVTLSRNKENADALLNSNDKMLEKMFDFEEKLGSTHNELLDKQRSMIDDSMKELQESLKSEFAEAINALKEMQPVVAPTEPVIVQPTETNETSEMFMVDEPEPQDVIPEEPLMEEPLMEESLMEEPLIEEPLMEEPLMEEPLMEDIGDDISLDGLDLGIDVGEALPENEEESLSEESDDLGLDTTFDLGIDVGEDIAENEGESLSEESDDLGLDTTFDLGIDVGEDMSESEEESLSIDGDDLGLDTNFDLGIDVGEDEVSEEISTEQVEQEIELEEAAQPEKVDMPDLSDPHKLMTPDEIAALLANM